MQTDNSYFADKVNLRMNFLPDKKKINVLDCFNGKGLIWNEVKRKIDKEISITGIEKVYKKNNINFCIYGDNLKILKNLDLSNYDIIDVDAYGSPSKQLCQIFNNKTLKINTVIFYMNIYAVFGVQSKEVLKCNGISIEMYRKNPVIFNKKRDDFFYNFLYNFGIKQIFFIKYNNKEYGCFKYNPV